MAARLVQPVEPPSSQPGIPIGDRRIGLGFGGATDGQRLLRLALAEIAFGDRGTQIVAGVAVDQQLGVLAGEQLLGVAGILGGKALDLLAQRVGAMRIRRQQGLERPSGLAAAPEAVGLGRSAAGCRRLLSPLASSAFGAARQRRSGAVSRRARRSPWHRDRSPYCRCLFDQFGVSRAIGRSRDSVRPAPAPTSSRLRRVRRSRGRPLASGPACCAAKIWR